MRFKDENSLFTSSLKNGIFTEQYYFEINQQSSSYETIMLTKYITKEWVHAFKDWLHKFVSRGHPQRMAG